MARFGAGRRRRATSTSRRSAQARPAPRTGCRATYATDTDLPATFAVKLPAQDDAVRERVALGYRSEVEFYTDVADKVRIPVPRCFYSDISDDGADFVLLLADMAPAVQGDQIAGCTPQEARLAVEALAGLHGPSWCDPSWLGLSGHLDAQAGRRGARPRASATSR